MEAILINYWGTPLNIVFFVQHRGFEGNAPVRRFSRSKSRSRAQHLENSEADCAPVRSIRKNSSFYRSKSRSREKHPENFGEDCPPVQSILNVSSFFSLHRAPVLKTFSFEQHTSYTHVVNMTVMTCSGQLHNVPHENTQGKHCHKVPQVGPFQGTEIIVRPPKDGYKVVSKASYDENSERWDNRPEQITPPTRSPQQARTRSLLSCTPSVGLPQFLAKAQSWSSGCMCKPS